MYFLYCLLEMDKRWRTFFNTSRGKLRGKIPVNHLLSPILFEKFLIHISWYSNLMKTKKYFIYQKCQYLLWFEEFLIKRGQQMQDMRLNVKRDFMLKNFIQNIKMISFCYIYRKVDKLYNKCIRNMYWIDYHKPDA